MTDHERDDWGDDGGLRSRLDAYADARLRPDPEMSARSRARVMAEARAALDAPRGIAAARRRRSPFATARGPRLRLSLLAGAWLLVALVAAGGVLAGSGPGGPFYAARLWVEELALPAEAGARAAAQADRLEERLAEAEQAARAGNGPAVTAALEAYRAMADAALANAGDDPTRLEHLAAQLGLHVAVLEALVPLVPGPASDAIRTAVDRTETRIQEILATPKPTAPSTPEATPNPAATPKPGKSPPSTPEATPNPAATPKPGKSPPGKPEATPEPADTPKPGKSPPGRPEATPNPAPTPAP